MVTLKELAKEFKVSALTVSKVLHASTEINISAITLGGESK